jgi:hypothetical protein
MFIGRFSKKLLTFELIGSHSEHKLNTFYSKLNYLPNVKFAKKVKTLKYECIFPVSFQRLVLAYSSNKSALKSDPNMTRMKSVDFIDFETQKKIFQENGWQHELGDIERNLLIQISNNSVAFPLNPRVMHMGTTATYDPENRILNLMSKPFVYQGFNFFESTMMDVAPKQGQPVKKMKAYPIFDFFFLRYQQIDEKKVLFSQVHIFDLGGWASGNEFLTKKVAQQRGEIFLESIQMMLKEYPEGSTIEENKKEMLKVDNEGKIIDGLAKMIYELKIEKNSLN